MSKKYESLKVAREIVAKQMKKNEDIIMRICDPQSTIYETKGNKEYEILKELQYTRHLLERILTELKQQRLQMTAR